MTYLEELKLAADLAEEAYEIAFDSDEVSVFNLVDEAYDAFGKAEDAYRAELKKQS